MIKVGDWYRTTEDGAFRAGNNQVRVEAVGPDWVLGRDREEKLYVAHVNPGIQNWEPFRISEPGSARGGTELSREDRERR
jgi:hypothetical protein